MSAALEKLRELTSFAGVPALVEAVPYPVVVVDADGRVRCSNAPARARLASSQSTLGEPELPSELRERQRAWAAGAPPQPLVVATTAGERRLVVPFPLPGEPGAFACVLFDVGDSGSAGPKWFVAGAVEHEAHQDATAIRELDARRRDDASFARLTTREWEIARRIAAGDRVSLLAEDLRISPNTVRNHLKAIFRKLNVNSQPQLVRTVRSLARARGATAD